MQSRCILAGPRCTCVCLYRYRYMHHAYSWPFWQPGGRQTDLNKKSIQRWSRQPFSKQTPASHINHHTQIFLLVYNIIYTHIQVFTYTYLHISIIYVCTTHIGHIVSFLHTVYMYECMDTQIKLRHIKAKRIYPRWGWRWSEHLPVP